MDGKAAFHVLHLLETPRIGIAKVYAILDMANSYAMSLSDFLYKPSSLKEVLNDSQIDAFLALEDKTRQIWDDLEEKGVQLVPVTDDNYPERLRTLLGKKAPPLLMVQGNTDLLKKLSVGFCGSRKASPKGIATAKDCAVQLAREGVNIVSGYAAGIDMATHLAALECGGTTTLVLCEGILNFSIKREIKDLWDWERIAVVSEFLPGLPWNAHNAMQRNRTICALSAAMILIEAGNTGGSIEAGRTCLRMGVPLFAPVYEGMPESAVGNRELLQQGAYSLLKNRRTGRANMGTMLSVIKGKVPDSKKKNDFHEIETLETDQLSLFDSRKDYSPKNKCKRQES
ncbi:MAG: DNA-processing protein DprA [Thermodesulfobacteriota bacterium]